jgi:hypothetical protein
MKRIASFICIAMIATSAVAMDCMDRSFTIPTSNWTTCDIIQQSAAQRIAIIANVDDVSEHQLALYGTKHEDAQDVHFVFSSTSALGAPSTPVQVNIAFGDDTQVSIPGMVTSAPNRGIISATRTQLGTVMEKLVSYSNSVTASEATVTITAQDGTLTKFPIQLKGSDTSIGEVFRFVGMNDPIR